MSSSHSPHDLLLLLPLQKSSSCNCQYKLKKYCNYFNNNNNNKTIYNNNIVNNYNNIKNNNNPENILLWVLVVPLLISTTPSSIKTKLNSSQSGTNPAKQFQTSRTVIISNTITTTRNKDVQQTKSIKLWLRTLRGSLIQQIILINLYQLQILLLLHNSVLSGLFKDLNSLREVSLVLHKTSNIRWCSFIIHRTPLTSTTARTTTRTKRILKESSSAAHFQTQPEEAFKSRLLYRKYNISSQKSIYKRLLSIHNFTLSSILFKDFIKRLILLIVFTT